MAARETNVKHCVAMEIFKIFKINFQNFLIANPPGLASLTHFMFWLTDSHIIFKPGTSLKLQVVPSDWSINMLAGH